jgi:hypothetical protein
MYSMKWYCVSLFFPKPNHNVLSPNSPIQLSVSDLFIPRIGLPILYLGIHKSDFQYSVPLRVDCLYIGCWLCSFTRVLFSLQKTLSQVPLQIRGNNVLNAVERAVSIVLGSLLKPRCLEHPVVKWGIFNHAVLDLGVWSLLRGLVRVFTTVK